MKSKNIRRVYLVLVTSALTLLLALPPGIRGQATTRPIELKLELTKPQNSPHAVDFKEGTSGNLELVSKGVIGAVKFSKHEHLELKSDRLETKDFRAGRSVGQQGDEPGNRNACGTYSAGELVQAASQLIAAKECRTTVNSPAVTVHFKARDRIILSPGFIALATSKFVASIDTGFVEKEFNSFSPQLLEIPAGPLETNSKTISITPNPFHSTFDLSIRWKQDQKVQVTVYNSLGSKVKEKQGINFSKAFNKISFDCSNLAKGVYFVEVIVSGVRTVEKVVKL